MRLIRVPGILAYVVMAMWLLQLVIAPAGAATQAGTRLADHLDAVRAALAAHGAPADARVELATPDAVIAAGRATPLLFDSVSYNPASGRFLIRARIDEAGSPFAIAGEALVAATVPVPARDIARNEIIAEADLDWIDMTDPRASLFVTDADLVIGKAARRPLARGAPLRKADLVAPVLVKRGDIATIILEAPGLRLTQSAVALGNGGEGDAILFRNVNSDREFKAVVFARGAARALFRSNSNFASLE